ncbi:hypothetical protein Hanom_Chr11g01011091 [Helianthus anomalus]
MKEIGERGYRKLYRTNKAPSLPPLASTAADVSGGAATSLPHLSLSVLLPLSRRF